MTSTSRFSSRLAAFTATAAGAVLAAACVVVPIDPRTGQPYPLPPSDANAPRHSTTVVMPPPPAAPPAPSVLTARLYPLNVQAQKGGLLTAVVVDSHSGRGTFTLGYLGDTLQGEATRVDAGYAAFGRLHQEVLGPSARAYGGQRGIANAAGSKGVSAQCEYQITAPGQGTGVCLFSDGARWQMHFGG